MEQLKETIKLLVKHTEATVKKEQCALRIIAIVLILTVCNTVVLTHLKISQMSVYNKIAEIQKEAAPTKFLNKE